MLITEAILLILIFKNLFFHKLSQINSRNDGHMFESIHQSVSILNVNATAKPFFFFLILTNKIWYINSIVIIPSNGIVLNFRLVAQPFINFVVVGLEIWVVLVYSVEVSLVRWKIDEFVDVLSFCC